MLHAVPPTAMLRAQFLMAAYQGCSYERKCTAKHHACALFVSDVYARYSGAQRAEHPATFIDVPPSVTMQLLTHAELLIALWTWSCAVLLRPRCALFALVPVPCCVLRQHTRRDSAALCSARRALAAATPVTPTSACRPSCFKRNPELLCTFVVHMAAAAVRAVPALVNDGRFEPVTDAFAPHADPEDCPACLPLGSIDSETAFGDTYRHAAVRERQRDALRGAMVRGELAAVLRCISVVRSQFGGCAVHARRTTLVLERKLTPAWRPHSNLPGFPQSLSALCLHNRRPLTFRPRSRRSLRYSQPR